MTTLDVDQGALRDAVARFTIVRDVVAEPDFPHTLRIRVIERIPVGTIVSESGEVAVADDGTLLRDTATSGLPTIISPVPPSGARVTGRKMQVKVALLAAAPRRLRSRVVRVTLGPQGLVAVLSSGPKLRFGDGGRLHAKWIAALRVLSDPAARTAAYIDLRVPERPAAGGLTVAEGGTQVEPPAEMSIAPQTGQAAAGAGAAPAAGTPTAQPGSAAQPGAGNQPAATAQQPATATPQQQV
jgi:cell division protein FtsQ